MIDLTLTNNKKLVLQVTDPYDAVRHFWTVERFFHITTVAATVNLVLLFVILFALTVPEFAQLFTSISIQ